MKALVATLVLMAMSLPNLEISVFDPPRQAPAEAPFQVVDDWQAVSQPGSPAFELRLDGLAVGPAHTVARVEECGGVRCLQALTIYDFTQGVASGVHVFNAVWPATCATTCEVRLAAQRLWVTTFLDA